MTATRGRACIGKKSHTSRQAADAHRARLIEGGAAESRIRVYHCRHCGHWHVGHVGRHGRARR